MIAPGNGKFYCVACGKELTIAEINAAIKSICEACGDEFDVDDGYYEAGEYSYCKECCHW